MDLSEARKLERPAKLDEASSALLEAAALIETHGHCQTGVGFDGVRMCVIAALSSSRYGYSYAAVLRLADNIPDLPPHDNRHKVARWSDSTPTAQVLAKLRAVALGG